MIQRDVVQNDEFSTKISGLEPELWSMLKGMLQFNPEIRLSAFDCLESSIFNSIRNETLEKLGKNFKMVVSNKVHSKT